MTFHISGCKHDTKLILVSILTFSRSRISKCWKQTRDLDGWPWNSRSHTCIVWPSLTPAVYNYTWCRLDLSVDSNIFWVEDLRKPKINHLTLIFDLENLGQTFFCMTFHIIGCKHDTKSILVSISTFSISRISKILKINTWPYRLTLKLKVIHFFHMTLLISGCMPAIYSILVSNLTYSRSRISENLFLVTWPWCLTFIFKVKPLFFKFILFSRSVIIDTLFISNLLSFLTSN